MKKLLFAFVSFAFFAALSPFILSAADTADNAQILQLTPNGDWVPTQIVFNSASVGQDITIQSTGLLGVNPVTKGTVLSSVLVSGSATSLTTATPKDITTLSLTAGTWRLYGYVDYILASATTTVQQSGLGTTANTFSTQDTSLTAASTTTTASLTLTQATPYIQVTIASTTVFHLVASITFSAGTVTGYGSLLAQQIK
jgi:hypothetical protein